MPSSLMPSSLATYPDDAEQSIQLPERFLHYCSLLRLFKVLASVSKWIRSSFVADFPEDKSIKW